MTFRKIVALLLLALLAVFVGMNLERATVWLFGIRAEMPIALLVLVAGALGFGAGLLLAFVKKAKPAKGATPRA
ncbi:MAG TPA: hypothetical protein VGR31_11270 [Planctomycetota bacterium]|jgi:uncharacterized integral membrane protein|nr:hypothetical protein [Planctomycetota bacterium]